MSPRLQGLREVRAAAALFSAALGAALLAAGAVLLKAFVWSRAPPAGTLGGLAAAALVAAVLRTGKY
jgi:hypothetical protein